MTFATFQSLFCSTLSSRDKFLSRLFGIFNEEIVRCWSNASQAPYENLGRPTIRSVSGKPYTLDFTFRSKNDGGVYIAEMKCELEYENYRYLTLESSSQLHHHNQDAFRFFPDAARNTNHYKVTVKGRMQAISGSILVWGRCTEQGRMSAIAEYGFRDVLSLEAIINDLLLWHNQEYFDLIRKYEEWCKELFVGLRCLGDYSSTG